MKPAELNGSEAPVRTGRNVPVLNDQVRFTSSNDVIEGKVVQVGPILVVRATDGRRWAVGSGDVLVLEDAHS